jgi:hypothetical protein
MNRGEQAAFPIPGYGDQGVTIREWLAAQAMAGLLAGATWDATSAKLIAKTSFAIADAMIEASGSKP